MGPRDKVRKVREGYQGWDDYAPFYDWENARTLGRRDVPFWRRVAAQARGTVLELGCGTGRVSLPLARAGVDLVGIDRSEPMLARARKRAARARVPVARGFSRARLRMKLVKLVRGDIRALPFPSGAFSMVLAPYGILQSLTRDRDLTETLASAARVLEPGGLLRHRPRARRPRTGANTRTGSSFAAARAAARG